MARFRSMKMFTVAAAALAMTAGACSRADNLLPPEDVDTPLFEVDNQNGAWGSYWAGFYVDASGNVWAWDRSEARNTPDLADSVLTPQQIARKYSAGRKQVRTVSAQDALQRFQQAGVASQQPLAAEKGGCADAGIQRFSAWVFDTRDNKYHRVLLHQRGDVSTTRLSPAAREAWKWLEQVTTGPSTNWSGCDPYGS